MKLFALSAAAACAAVSVVSASAQTHKMRPGLWEHSHTMTSQSGQIEQATAQMQKQLAALPPEQRKMMEQMMQKQGVSMGPKGTSVKVCVTQADADRDQLPADSGCTWQVTQRSANAMKTKFTCVGPPPSSGEGEFTFLSPTAYTGKAVMQMVVDGKPERMNLEHSGRWLSADCGTIKPHRR